jgi:glycosyltransferase involved in cell wall biosynthesis
VRITVVSESPLQFCGGRFFAVDPWVRFVIHLAQGDDDVTLVSPTKDVDAPSADSWPLEAGRLRIQRHDNYNSYVGFAKLWLRRRGHWRREFEKAAAASDVIVLRLPSPSLNIVRASARAAGTPLVLMVAGDTWAQSDRILASRGIVRTVYRAVTKALVRQEVDAGREAAIVFAYSSELAERHRGANVRRMRTPHLTARDFSMRADTCASPAIRLVRVCWLIPSKGLECLLEAVADLRKRGVNVSIDLVGKERTAGYQHQLEQKAERLGIGEHVHFLGWVPFDRMMAVYDAADVQVISSLAEGTPRCIVEGMARGLPLVCTRVGGCGDYLTDGVDSLLVPAGDASAIAVAVERVIRDGELRRRLISGGYSLARQATFEVLGQTFLQELRTVNAR